MVTLTYICPNTKRCVHGLIEVEIISDDEETYAPVRCIECTAVHLINPKTGRLLGDDTL
jgi:hypothetical protein